MKPISHPGTGSRLIVAVSAMLASLCMGLQAQPGIRPSGASAFTVVLDDSYPPYSFRADDGTLVGIAVDLWKLWSQKTGRAVSLVGLDWNDAIQALENGKADAIDMIFETRDRDQLFDFGPPWADIGVSVYYDSRVGKVKSLSALSGFIIGAKANDAGREILEAQGRFEVRTYPNYRDIIDAAETGGIHAFVMDDPPARFYLAQRNIDARFLKAVSVAAGGSFHRAVRKGDLASMSLVESGFSAISASEQDAIVWKWTGPSYEQRRLLRLFGLVSAVAALLILALAAVSIVFRRQVAQKTRLLSGSLADLERSEARTKALLEAIPDLIFIVDGEGRLLYLKPSASLTLAISEGSYKGKDLGEFLSPEELVRAKALLADCSKDGMARSSDTMKTVAGSVRTFESRILPFGADRFLIIVRDATEQRAAERDSMRRQKLESLGIFAGGIAHDFNNILTAIVGSLSLARSRTDLPPQTEALLQQAENAAIRASTLTNQLLTFAKGGAPLRQAVDLEALCRETASFALSGSACAVDFAIGEGPFIADVDRGQISQVVHNIVLNGAQAMPGGGTIRLSLSRIAGTDGKDRIQIEIADSGTGISPANLARIFDPYFTTKKSGTGLGLAICHTIVKRHGGSIAASSELGKGSVFTILLPASPKSGFSADAQARAAPTAGIRPVRTLVMDDEEPIRNIFGTILESMGFPYDVAAEGGKALELFCQAEKEGKPYGLMIADLTVPGGMVGRELLERIRAEGSPLKALVVSGYSNDPVLADFRAYGFDACLAKPFRARDLVKALAELLSPTGTN